MLRINRDDDSKYELSEIEQLSSSSRMRRCPSLENLLDPKRIETARLEYETGVINDLKD